MVCIRGLCVVWFLCGVCVLYSDFVLCVYCGVCMFVWCLCGVCALRVCVWCVLGWDVCDYGVVCVFGMCV